MALVLDSSLSLTTPLLGTCPAQIGAVYPPSIRCPVPVWPDLQGVMFRLKGSANALGTTFTTLDLEANMILTRATAPFTIGAVMQPPSVYSCSLTGVAPAVTTNGFGDVFVGSPQNSDLVFTWHNVPLNIVDEISYSVDKNPNFLEFIGFPRTGGVMVLDKGNAINWGWIPLQSAYVVGPTSETGQSASFAIHVKINPTYTRQVNIFKTSYTAFI